MSFPISPVDNELATVNGITYIYNLGFNSWTKVTPQDLNFQGNLYVTNFDSLKITANSVLPKSYTDNITIVFGV